MKNQGETGEQEINENREKGEQGRTRTGEQGEQEK